MDLIDALLRGRRGLGAWPAVPHPRSSRSRSRNPLSIGGMASTVLPGCDIDGRGDDGPSMADRCRMLHCTGEIALQ